MNFVFFSPIAWDNMEGAHRPVRFAAELARRGHRITYVELDKSIVKPSDENIRVTNLVELGMPEQRVIAAYYGFDYGGMDDALAPLERILARGEPRRGQNVAIFSAPFRPFLEFLPLLRSRGSIITFDMLDDYVAMRRMGYYCFDADAEKFLAQNCDLALPLTPRLVEKCRTYGATRICLMKDGIDLAVWQNADAKSVSVERGTLTLGFWGWIWSYNVDVALLWHMARTRTRWRIDLLGPYDTAVSQALNFPNVRFHGKVSRDQIAAYARNFDVCLLPVPNDEFNRARDPLKVYEYLACHKPVVATDQPQLGGVPGVYLSHDVDEFTANVERASRESFDSARVDRFLAEQTWEKRVDLLLAQLTELPDSPRPMPDPPRGAMPNAKNEVDRWQAYTQHLERLVADREAHVADLERALESTGVRARLKQVLRR